MALETPLSSSVAVVCDPTSREDRRVTLRLRSCVLALTGVEVCLGCGPEAVSLVVSRSAFTEPLLLSRVAPVAVLEAALPRPEVLPVIFAGLPEEYRPKEVSFVGPPNALQLGPAK